MSSAALPARGQDLPGAHWLQTVPWAVLQAAVGQPKISLCWPRPHEGTERCRSTALQIRKSCNMLSSYSAAMGPCTTRRALLQLIPHFLHPWGNIHDPGQQTCLSKGKGHRKVGCSKAKPHTDARDLAAKHPYCTQRDQPVRTTHAFAAAAPGPLPLLFCREA